MIELRVGGIHHVTAIAGDPQENVDFYAGLLGMRLVKRSVNQDDPGTYHLFYADAEGHPGSDLTFFPWAHGAPGANGAGMVNEVALAVPERSLPYWRERLAAHGVRAREETRFAEPTLAFHDPHGLRVALTESPRADERAFAAWPRSPVPAERQIRGLHAVRIVERVAEDTRRLVTEALGMRLAATDGEWERFAGFDAASGYLDLHANAAAPRGSVSVGTVHHVAWRVTDDAHQARVQAAVRAFGASTTPVIDRFWFRSVYFREPGGVLFELATDGPGFGVDEPLESLGETLVLPPWLEPHRPEIEAVLQPLRLPQPPSAEARP